MATFSPPCMQNFLHSTFISDLIPAMLQESTTERFLAIDKDIDTELSLFYERLLDRGHQPSNILPIFEKAISNAIKYLSQDEAYRQQQKEINAKASNRRVFFHLPYHSNNPPSRKNQNFAPKGKTPLNLLTNSGTQFLLINLQFTTVVLQILATNFRTAKLEIVRGRKFRHLFD
ncbi:hypothetical protein ACHAXR_001258 [Thalassiosira sp. AJA248-18]